MNQEIIFRITFFAAFLATFCISAFYRRKARQQSEVIPRRKEGNLALIGRLTIGLPLLVFILLYTFIPGWIDWSTIPVPLWLRWAGAASVLYCPLLSIWVFTHIGKNISETVLTKQDHQLVTSGPYRWVRHPLYTTGILLIFSLALIASNGIIFLMGFISMIVFRFIVIPKEEEHLVEKFGEEYENYRLNTGAMLPGF